jgi:nitrate/TMAO reductase-like tetraheme cytochrome c subunit
VQLEIVYQHTQPTIRSINDMLNKAQKWTGVTVQEDSHDREHRQAGAERRGQELKAEKSRGKSQDRGPSIGG